MNDDLWDKARGLGSETLKRCAWHNLIQFNDINDVNWNYTRSDGVVLLPIIDKDMIDRVTSIHCWSGVALTNKKLQTIVVCIYTCFEV